MRVLLEGYGIRNSRANLTSTHIQRLLDILEDLQTMIDAGDTDAYARVDEQLHNEIVSLGNNSIVSSAYYRVGSMNQQFRVLSLNIRQRFEESRDEHRQVIHAIIQGRRRAGRGVNRRHLELARSCIKGAARKKEMIPADKWLPHLRQPFYLLCPLVDEERQDDENA